MRELPDIEIYIEALKLRLDNATLVKTTLGSPFPLGTVTPAIKEFEKAH